MDARTFDLVLDQLRYALEQNDLEGAKALIEALRPADQADLITRLDDEDQVILLPQLDPESSADIFEEMDEEDVAELAEALPQDTLARIVDEMEPDEAADLLGDIPVERAEAVLSQLEDPEEVRPLLIHPDDSAGGLMTSSFLALRPKMTVEEALRAVRAWQPEPPLSYYLFVVDAKRRLVGVVDLRTLILASPETRIEELMDPDVITVLVGTDQEACARLMQHYDLLALPVVDEDGHLLGVITVDDVLDVMEDEATEDIHRFGGAEPLERSYLETSVLTIVRKRFGWLLLLFVTASLTGTVMRMFQDQIQAVVALSVFIPMVIGTGGNAGSQTTSTIIRALAVGDIQFRDLLRVLWHEVGVGFLLGLGMSVVGYGRAMLWGSQPDLALTVGVTMLAVLIWATGMGALLPVLASRLGIDPAIVSGPVMSTLVDATGLYIYFTVARLVMGI